MKPDRSGVISGASLLVSLVCLAGVLHVEYKLYKHVDIQTKHVQTDGDAAKNLYKNFQRYLGKETIEEIRQSGFQVRHRRDIRNASFIADIVRSQMREELKNFKILQVLKGLRGRRGRRGLSGPRGKMGPSGPRGKHGPRGPQGPQGPKGMIGASGPQGPPGKLGSQGPKGPKGDPADPIAAPTILVPPKDLAANKSDTVLLKCVTNGNPPPIVTWSKKNSSLPIGRHVIDAHGFLSIKQLTSNETGEYTCRATSVLGVAMASSLLTVQVPPSIITKPEAVIAEESFNVTLHCSASGFPRPTISWAKIIGALPQNRAMVLLNNSLVIKNIKKADGGTYICTAENLLGRVTTHAQIAVLPALKFTLRPPSQSQHIFGERVVIDCQAVNALELIWMKDNKPLSGSTIVHSNGTLVITNLSTKDTGNYVCIARNFHRSIKSTTKLTIRIPKSCSELKTKSPSTTSGNYVIDPDGQSGKSQFTVYCNMTDQGGVTVVSHDSEARTLIDGYELAGSYRKDVRYNGVSMANLAKLTEISTNCEQFIEYECFNDVGLLDISYGWWVSRDDIRQNYWGGATPGSRKCACGMTNKCQDKSQVCNCWNGGSGWRSDNGLLTDKTTLPVSQLRFGDTGGDTEQAYHTLGKLKCYG